MAHGRLLFHGYVIFLIHHLMLPWRYFKFFNKCIVWRIWISPSTYSKNLLALSLRVILLGEFSSDNIEYSQNILEISFFCNKKAYLVSRWIGKEGTLLYFIKIVISKHFIEVHKEKNKMILTGNQGSLVGERHLHKKKVSVEDIVFTLIWRAKIIRLNENNAVVRAAIQGVGSS